MTYFVSQKYGSTYKDIRRFDGYNKREALKRYRELFNLKYKIMELIVSNNFIY